MSEAATVSPPVATRVRRINPWSVGALLIALLILSPILSVVVIALTPVENIWPHLMATTLPRYLYNTVVMMLGAGIVAGMIGTGAAWLLSVYRFPLSRMLSWALLLPLGIPAYVGAYALVDFLEYAGPVQTALRETFGWQNARAYWFPEIRSRWAAVLVLAGALYPYVYLLARTAFRDMSGATIEVAESLGAGPFKRFYRVGLPMARPAIAAGVAVVMMETVNDFGVMDYFAVQTLTTGIFSVWLESYNAGGAAQIAMVVLAMVLILVALEKTSRRKLRFFQHTRRHQPMTPTRLSGAAAWLATVVCILPFAFGFVLPAGVIGHHAVQNAGLWLDPALIDATVNTVVVGGAAALLTVLGAVFVVYGVRISGSRLARLAMPVTTIGYAAPGAVLGVGLLIPMAASDHLLADTIEAISGVDIGLLMTGTGFALVLVYTMRFFAISVGAVDAALGRVSPSLPMAARSLGRSSGATLRAVYMPLIKGSLGTAFLLVFVDSVKELPATLLLKPFNYNTLATQVYEQASLENLGDASAAAVLVIAVGLVAVLTLVRTQRL